LRIIARQIANNEMHCLSSYEFVALIKLHVGHTAAYDIVFLIVFQID